MQDGRVLWQKRRELQRISQARDTLPKRRLEDEFTQNRFELLVKRIAEKLNNAQ